MSRSRAEKWRRPLRWLSAVAMVALVPKCLVCLATYVGLGALLGIRFAGTELCGATTGNELRADAWLAIGGLLVVALVFSRWVFHRCTHRHLCE